MNRVRFYKEERRAKDSGNVAIVLSYWFNGTQLKYYTGIQVKKINYNDDYWKLSDTHKKERKPVKSQEHLASKINDTLQLMEMSVHKLHSDAIVMDKPLTIAYFKDALDKKFKGKGNSESDIMTFKKAWSEYLDFLKHNRAESTYKKQKTAKTHLEAYLKSKFNSLTFENIDNKFVEGFRKYLVGLEFREGKYYQINTVAKYLNCLRDFLNWCKSDKRGYFSGSVSFDVKEEDIEVISLTIEEISVLGKAKMPNSTLHKVKDIYMFACYTGIRYGDIYNLNKTDLKGNILTFLIGKGKKITNHKVVLPAQALEIIKKYEDLPGDKLLPVFTNQKMNSYLKDVMKEAEFTELITVARKMGNGSIVKEKKEKWEIITFHSSRKTFVDLAIASDVQEVVIKAMTGHSPDSRAFKKYFKVSDDLKTAALSKMFPGEKNNLKAV